MLSHLREESQKIAILRRRWIILMLPPAERQDRSCLSTSPLLGTVWSLYIGTIRPCPLGLGQVGRLTPAGKKERENLINNCAKSCRFDTYLRTNRFY
uniref:Uncharacterized protein n=1 Tax=Rhizoctonia solani TaxID=456999 RepID=N0A552_9AGAM|nr:hypothetical protein RSOL_m00410 [Rhizoctonia solani]AGK45375.1 hypothetical protein RSOL_m00410 [Rhizoctonia solani]